jgi:tetratricopeptide (TPR) repeat protein
MKFLKSSNLGTACFLGIVGCWFLISVMPVGAADNFTKAALQGDWPQVYEEGMKSSTKNSGLERDLLLGYACMYRKDWVKAWHYFSTVDQSPQKTTLLPWAENLCRENPKSAMALVFKGDALIRLGRYQEAGTALDRAVQINPQLALAFELRGLARFNASAGPQAKADLDAALRVDSLSVNVLYERALLDLNAKDYRRAETELSSLLAKEPKFFLARNARGIAYLLQAKYDPAIKDFDEALQECRDLVSAQQNKEYALRLRSDKLLAEDLKKMAQPGAKGPLGSMSLAVGGDSKSVAAATKSQIEVAQKIYGKENVIATSNWDLARQSLAEGKNVVFQVDSSKGGSLTQVLNNCRGNQIEVKSIITNGYEASDQTLTAIRRFKAQGVTVTKNLTLTDPSEMSGLAGKTGTGITNLDLMARSASSVNRGGTSVKIVTTEEKFGVAHIGNISSFTQKGVTVYSRKWEGQVTSGVGIPAGVSGGLSKASDAAGRTGIDQKQLWTKWDGNTKTKTFENNTLVDILSRDPGRPSSRPDLGGTTSSTMLRQGIYLRQGKPGMDVTTAPKQNLDFLQKDGSKPKSTPVGKKLTREMLLSHPFLIANP